MSGTHFELYIGASTEGCSIHPHYEEGKHPSLDDAKAHAESLTGRRLSWEWMSDRDRWRARVGLGQAAEIQEGPSEPVRLVVSVGQM